MKTHTDSERQELGARLVRDEVYYCVSSLIQTLATVAGNCDTKGELDYEEILELCVRDDWETPAQEFIQNDADLDDLETIAEDNGYWSEVLEECGVPETVHNESHKLCDDCHMHLQIPEPEPDLTEERLLELDHHIAMLPSPIKYREEHDDEFSICRCDCCGSTMGGPRYSYTDLTSETEDVEDRINATEDPKATMRLIRDKVDSLVVYEADYIKVCNDNSLDPERIEVYEHWLISNFLARKLAEKGEIVGEVCGLTIWGRCTTGQSISMDHVIQQIAVETYI